VLHIVTAPPPPRLPHMRLADALVSTTATTIIPSCILTYCVVYLVHYVATPQLISAKI